MKVTLIGDAARPAIAVVGTWDPFSLDCERLLGQLIGSAHARNASAAAIMLDPPPKVHIDGAHAFPLFHNSARRLDLLRRNGVDLIVRIEFVREDLYRTAADFFDAVCPHLQLEEFWLRHGQDLGRNVGGSQLAVTSACKKRSIRLRLLAEDPEARSAGRARDWLARGRVLPATQVAGCKPSFSRPPDGTLRVAYPPGSYVMADPSNASRRVRVEALAERDNMSALAWPSDVANVLEVVRGPRDDAAFDEAFESSTAQAYRAARRSTLIQELFHASGAPRS